jgi:hypothetical protein
MKHSFSTFFLFMALVPAVWACNSGTVRDAAFSDPRDEHRLCVFGAVDDSEANAAFDALEAWFQEHGERLNVYLERVDTSAPEVSWKKYGLTDAPPTLPSTVLVGSPNLFHRPFMIDHWEPAPSTESLTDYFGPPSLVEAKKHLVDIWAVVLYAPGAEAGDAGRGIVQTVVEEWGAAHPPGLAMVEVDRNDPKERMLVNMLDLAPEGPNWAAIFFGPGMLKAPLFQGEDLTKEKLSEQLDELTVPCTCLADAMIMGLDLPMVWEKALDDKFAQLEEAATSGYSEINFEEEVEVLVEKVEKAEPAIFLAVLISLAALGSVVVLVLVFLVLRSRRRPDVGDVE